jgi:hypothetical protein
MNPVLLLRSSVGKGCSTSSLAAPGFFIQKQWLALLA